MKVLGVLLRGWLRYGVEFSLGFRGHALVGTGGLGVEALRCLGLRRRNPPSKRGTPSKRRKASASPRGLLSGFMSSVGVMNRS